MRSRLQLLTLLVAMILLGTGCKAMVRSAATEAPRAAVPIIFDESLKQLEDAETRNRIARVLATPEVEQAIHELAKVAVVGALDGARNTESQAHLKEVTDALSVAVVGSLTREVGREIAADGPAMRHTLAAFSASATTAALHAAANDIPTNLAPALRTSLVTELNDPSLKQAFAGIVNDATRQVLLSSREAVTDRRDELRDKGQKGIFDWIRTAMILVAIAVFLVGALLVSLLVAMVRARRREQRFKHALSEVLSLKEGAAEGAEQPPSVLRLIEELR